MASKNKDLKTFLLNEYLESVVTHEDHRAEMIFNHLQILRKNSKKWWEFWK